MTTLAPPAIIGDLDNDGIDDLAIGSNKDNDGGSDRGAVWILFMDSNDQVKSHQKISDTQGNFNNQLDNGDRFGISIAPLGDLNGDGIEDIAVGSLYDDDGGTNHGAVYILFLDTNGTVKSHQKISDTQGGFNGALSAILFGVGVRNIGDFNKDGITDITVSSPTDNDGGSQRGSFWILYLDTNGTVKGHTKISDTQGGFTGNLDDNDQFGRTPIAIGDLDGDGVTDIATGTTLDDDGGTNYGAVYILFMNANGSVKSHQKISATQGGFTGDLSGSTLTFGLYLASLDDIDGDNVPDILVCASNDNDGGPKRGAFWLLFLNSNGTVKNHQKISNTNGGFIGNLDDNDLFGADAAVQKTDDCSFKIYTRAAADDDGGVNRGALWVLNTAKSPNLSFSSQADVCASDTIFNIEGAQPLNGNFTGPGVRHCQLLSDQTEGR